MNFDSLVLAAVAAELQQTLLGGKVEKIAQPDPLKVVLTIYQGGQKHHLLFSCEPSAARLYLTGEARKSPPTPPAFCMLLRKYLEGAFLEAIEHPLGYGERVVRLALVGHDGARCFLWAELMGKHSNLILTGEAGTILGAIKRVTFEMSRFRQVRPGLAYAPPPRQKGAKRDAFSPTAGNELPDASAQDSEGAEKWLLATFSGVSPIMAREAAARASGPPYSSKALWYGLNEILNVARLAEWAPVLILNGDGSAEGAYPLPLASLPAERQQRWSSISAALDRAWALMGRESAFAQEKAALISALARARKGREREMIDVDEGLLSASRAEEYKEIAQIIQASPDHVSEGQTEAALPDYFATEPSALRAVALDPRLTSQENAERYFRKYRKARDAQGALEARKERIAAALAAIEKSIILAEAAETMEELAAARQSAPTGEALGQAPGAGAPAPPSPFAGHKIRRYVSVDGWEILVGENATSNDYLTTRVAAPSDIWLHARAIPSAHAVIRSRNRPVAVSAAALRLAAEQVARRSHAKHARLVPVDYTLRKYVRKPRRAAPGEVTYSHEKTLDITPTDE